MLRQSLTLSLLIFILLFAAACSPANNAANNGHTNNEHTNNEHANNDHEHATDEESATVPNNGAVIHLHAPEDGATFTTAEDITVEIEVENFDLGVDGNHWHIIVDDAEYAMVMGGNTSDVLRGLEPGEYTITVRLSNGDHQDLEEGDSATITITE